MKWIVIPARRNSKGFPFKNRKLFPTTALGIDREDLSRVVVSTDDEEVISQAEMLDFKIHHRSPTVSSDTASTKDLLIEVSESLDMKPEDDIVMLYLTYPQRKYGDVTRIYRWYQERGAKSLLCKQEPKSHPYMCYHELPDDMGKRVIDHDLYRRQDYPSCFFVSYYVAIVNVEYLKLVNKNLYHPETLFYKIDDNIVDVDTEEDLHSIKHTL